MKQYRVIYRVISNGSWASETIPAINKDAARTAVIDSYGDDPIRIISVTLA